MEPRRARGSLAGAADWRRFSLASRPRRTRSRWRRWRRFAIGPSSSTSARFFSGGSRAGVRAGLGPLSRLWGSFGANASYAGQAQKWLWLRGRHVEVTPEPPPDVIARRTVSPGKTLSFSYQRRRAPPPVIPATRRRQMPRRGLTKERKRSGTGKFRMRLGRSAAHFVATDRE